MNTRTRLWLLAALILAAASASFAQERPRPTTVYVYDGAGNMTRSTSTTVDPLNCGTPGNICAAGTTCCPSLGGLCVDTRYDPNNCGACGRVCSGSLSRCSASQCVAPCGIGYWDCGGVCVTTYPCPVNQVE